MNVKKGRAYLEKEQERSVIQLKVMADFLQTHQEFSLTNLSAVHMVLGSGNDSVSVSGKRMSQPVYVNGQLYGGSTFETTSVKGGRSLFSDVPLAA